jgi:hypothetical protein
MRNAYKILAGQPEGKGPLGIATGRWGYNIKIDLTETEWVDVNRF